MGDDGDEVRHTGAPALLLVGVADRADGSLRVLRVGQDRGERRLVRDEDAHVLGMRRDERQGIDRAPAGGKEVDRPTDLADDPMEVVGVLLRRRLARRIRLRAALGAARVVGQDRPVGEVLRQRAEAGGAHRRSDQHQDRFGAGLVSVDVVCQLGARGSQGVGRRVGQLGCRHGHGCAPRMSRSVVYPF